MARDKGLLSDLQLRHWIKAGTPLAKADGNGLTFTLSTAGVAGWILRYRHGGRRRELTIGRYPDISLADARGIATIKRAEIMQGRNPAADKQKAKATAAKDWTVRELVKDYRAKKLVSLAHPSHEVAPALIRWPSGMGANGRRNGVPCRTMIQSATIQITPEILGLVASIDEFKGAWRALGTLAPDRLSALLRVATIESIGSSTRIEGSKLSDRDVERLLSNLQTSKFSTRDEQEVAGYAKVMEMVFTSWQDIALTENHIKQLHRDLLVHCEKDAWHRGHYKTSTNSVVAFDENGKQLGVVFETATPFDTPRLMTELVTWFVEERSAGPVHPLLLIGLWVVVFLEIHPFQDGNGRLSRVLTTLLLLQAGYAYVPYSSLGSVVEQSKEAYYLALRQTQGTIRSDAPNWQPWLMFFLRSLAEQVRRLNRKIEREKLVLAALPELSLQIVEFAREHGRVTMADAIRLTGSNRNTLKQHFRALVQRGQLGAHGAGRGAWYEIQ